MTRFPVYEGKDLIEILRGFGFFIERQRVSHFLLKHQDGRVTVVPVHAGDMIDPGLLTKILRDVELTREDLIREKKQKRPTAGLAKRRQPYTP